MRFISLLRHYENLFSDHYDLLFIALLRASLTSKKFVIIFASKKQIHRLYHGIRISVHLPRLLCSSSPRIRFTLGGHSCWHHHVVSFDLALINEVAVFTALLSLVGWANSPDCIS